MSKDMCSNSGLNNTLSRFQRANLEKAAATRVQALSVRTRSVLSAEISKIKAFESSEISNARHAWYPRGRVVGKERGLGIFEDPQIEVQAIFQFM